MNYFLSNSGLLLLRQADLHNNSRGCSCSLSTGCLKIGKSSVLIRAPTEEMRSIQKKSVINLIHHTMSTAFPAESIENVCSSLTPVKVKIPLTVYLIALYYCKLTFANKGLKLHFGSSYCSVSGRKVAILFHSPPSFESWTQSLERLLLHHTERKAYCVQDRSKPVPILFGVISSAFSSPVYVPPLFDRGARASFSNSGW